MGAEPGNDHASNARFQLARAAVETPLDRIERRLSRESRMVGTSAFGKQHDFLSGDGAVVVAEANDSRAGHNGDHKIGGYPKSQRLAGKETKNHLLCDIRTKESQSTKLVSGDENTIGQRRSL